MNGPPPPPPSRGLALVGFRGAGKTTVGRMVAHRLGHPFIDADAALVAAQGRSVRAIFEETGEAHFRDLEEQTLRGLTADPPAGLVLATGGGVVLREANRRLLRRFGFVVWLDADPAAVVARLSRNSRAVADRPALTAMGTLAELATLAVDRAPLYRAVADAEVRTDGRTAAQVAEAVLALWPLHPS